MASNKIQRSVFAVILCLALVAVAIWCLRKPQAPDRSGKNPGSTIPSITNPIANIPVPTPSTSASTSGQLQAMAASLRAATNAMSAHEQLEQLRAMLAAMPKDQAIALIRQFLDSKADADTHLGFKVGQGGLLDDAPTLRTFLLDELARLDPAAAADYSKTILQSKDSPDEWAVALRNLAWGDTSADGRTLLEQKTTEMLQYPPWQQNPSTGFLEAFDVAVYLGGTSLMPTLTSMLQQQNDPAISHASYLALDRLVINNPQTTLAGLLADPTSMQGHESTRADYFARADVSDPQQRQIVENYLLNPQISAAELNTFAGIFPNANYMISPNLLTQSQTPNHAALAARDAASLQAVQQWMTDPRFSQLQPELEQMQTRIAGYVQQETAAH
ncbi:MAG TPA: hypothetical protein VGN23_14465 [Verrucomicrobiae bacterium]|jgi:hypothetical protein